ncbi:MAG: Ig-like domain-containing protein [Gemmatimonadales bacterium]
MATVLTGPPPAAATGITTTCTLQSLVNPSEAGSPARFRFFSNNEGSIPGPTGLVTLLVDGVPLGIPEPLIPDGLTLDRSTLIIETSSLAPGTHLLSAIFIPVGLSTVCPGAPPTVTHEVRSSASVTTVTSSVNPTTWGQATNFTASVTKVGATPTGSLQFRIGGSPKGGPVALDAAGQATLTVSDLGAGNHAVEAAFISDNPATRNSEGALSGGQQVEQADTSTALTSAPNPAETGVGVTLTATVTVIAPGAGLATGSVQFNVDGAALGAPVALSGSGSAALTTASLAIGDRAVTATFAGNADLRSSSAGVTQTIERERTALAYHGATTADFHDPASLSATLTRQRDGVAVSGAGLVFTLGSQSCTAVTNSNGTAACTVIPGDPAGPSTVTVAFAGDTQRVGANASAAFTIAHEQTTLRLTTGAVALAGAPFAASAVLTEDDGAPVLPGRVVIFTLGASASCTASTDAAGRAQCSIPSGALPLGPLSLKVSFAQDPYYLAASATGEVILYAFPSSGAFVIGDRGDATGSAVQFFGSDWDKVNRLSTGEAPSSFKGFTASPGAPINCGATFRAATGNSDKPPSSVPSYMGTIVTTQVTQNGSTITGTRARLVVVRSSRYDPSPGRGGHGTVIASIPCSP